MVIANAEATRFGIEVSGLYRVSGYCAVCVFEDSWKEIEREMSYIRNTYPHTLAIVMAGRREVAC